MEIGRDKLLKIYTDMVRSRAFEDLVISAIAEHRMPGTWMSGVGQEGVVGALHALVQQDYITYTHRGIYYFISRGSDPRFLLAELYGKRTGYCRGKGGRHLADVEHRVFGKSGTIGGHAPIAVGMATAIQIRGDNAVVMSFFGDGASNRGTTHESMNMAAVSKLPIVWVCENNGYAALTPTAMANAAEDVANMAASYSMPGRCVDGNDVLAVYSAAEEAVARARAGEGPSLLELKTYRVREFAEGGWFPGGYQDAREVESWKERDPIDHLHARLLESGVLTPALAEEIQQRARAEMDAARQFAEESELPSEEEAFSDLYAQ